MAKQTLDDSSHSSTDKNYIPIVLQIVMGLLDQNIYSDIFVRLHAAVT